MEKHLTWAISAATSRMWMVPMGWIEPNVRWVDGHHDRIRKADRSSRLERQLDALPPMAMAGNALARGADNQLVFPQTLALFFTPSKASTGDSHGGGSLPIALVLIWMGIGILSTYLSFFSCRPFL